MKKTTLIAVLLTTTATLGASGILQAQSWSINGNANIAAGTNFLGTTDPNDLVFRSNAIERGRLLGTGNWRFGTSTDNAQFDAQGRLSFSGNAVYRVGSNKYAFQYSGDPDYGLFFNSTDARYEFRNGLATPVFSVDADNGALLAGTDFIFKTNNTERMRILNNGNVGVGIASPQVRLHVSGGVNVTLAGGGTIVMGPVASANLAMDNDEIQARNNGAASTLRLNQGGGEIIAGDDVRVNGDVVLNRSGDALVFDGGQDIRAGANLSIEVHGDLVPDSDASHSLGTSTKEWSEVWAVDASVNLTSNATTKNIKKSPYGIREIMKLKPVLYNRINNPEGGDGVQRLGLIAEDVKAVVPEAVKDWKYQEDKASKKISRVAMQNPGVSMQNIIAVLIGAIQEQQQEIEALKKAQGTAATTVTSGVTAEKSTTIKLNMAALEQNIPNPLRSNTSIRYNIPSTTKNALLIITDMNGKSIRQLAVKAGSGVINFDASSLPAGTYHYTLVADGKTVETKRMVVAR